jgi:GNAT superfamily N-acetyltransferase
MTSAEGLRSQSPSLQATTGDEYPTADFRLLAELEGSWTRRLALADGRGINVRPIESGDVNLLVEFHERLSSMSIHNRFFCAHPHLNLVEAEEFVGVDYDRRMAFVALDAGLLVGVGRYEGLDDRCSAEVAFVVADDYQGRGLASALLRLLARYAKFHGYSRLVAQMLTSNHVMREVFAASGYSTRFHDEDGVTDVELDIGTESTLREGQGP